MAEKKAIEPAEQFVDYFREFNQIVTASLVAAQERNVKFAQNMLTSTIEVMQSHIEATGALIQELEQMAKKQQDVFQQLVPGQVEHEWMEPYLTFLRMPFSYEETLKAMEKSTREGFKTVEQAIEDIEKVTLKPVLAEGERTKK